MHLSMKYVYLYCIWFAFIRCLYSYRYWISRRHLLVPATSQTSVREGVEVMDVNIRIPLNSFNWMHMSQKIGLTLYKLYIVWHLWQVVSNLPRPEKELPFFQPKKCHQEVTTTYPMDLWQIDSWISWQLFFLWWKTIIEAGVTAFMENNH